MHKCSHIETFTTMIISKAAIVCAMAGPVFDWEIHRSPTHTNNFLLRILIVFHFLLLMRKLSQPPHHNTHTNIDCCYWFTGRFNGCVNMILDSLYAFIHVLLCVLLNGSTFNGQRLISFCSYTRTHSLMCFTYIFDIGIFLEPSSSHAKIIVSHEISAHTQKKNILELYSLYYYIRTRQAKNMHICTYIYTPYRR